MGFFGRTLGMALGGGALGYANTGSLGGAAGGAAMGGAFGAVGFPMGRNFLARRGGLANLAGRGMGAIGGRASALGTGRLANAALGRPGTMLGDAFGYGSAGALGVGRGMAAGQAWLGKGTNAIAVNKWGGGALAALGLGASAHIGSSVISSNKGF